MLPSEEPIRARREKKAAVFPAARWDAFVECHPLGQIYHLSGWKRVIEQSFPHIRGYFPVIQEPMGGAIRAGLPVYFVNSLITGRRLVSIPFATLCDPLVTAREDMDLLLNALYELAGEVGAAAIEIKTCAGAETLAGRSLRQVNRFMHHCLKLDRPVETLKSNFHRSVRYCLKRSEKIGLITRNGDQRQDLRIFYDAYVSTRKRLGLPPQPYRFFECLRREFGPSGRLRILFAQHGRKDIASMLLLQFGRRVLWEAIGEYQGSRTLNVAHFLVWQAIQQSCTDGYSVFDFGRTSTENQGLMDFKRRWGTQVTDLPEFHSKRQVHPFMNNGVRTRAYTITRAITRRLPEKAVALIGELCYRHMG